MWLSESMAGNFPTKYIRLCLLLVLSLRCTPASCYYFFFSYSHYTIDSSSLNWLFCLLILLQARGDLTANIGIYPGYDGPIEINTTSWVDVSFDDSLDFEFYFHLYGVEGVCRRCGIQIYEGTTCNDASKIGDPYYNKGFIGIDPWIPENGVYYDTGWRNYTSISAFQLNIGYNEKETLGHAIVVHAQDGERIGCGLLVTKTMSQAQPLSLRYSLLNIPIIMLVMKFWE